MIKIDVIDNVTLTAALRKLKKMTTTVEKTMKATSIVTGIDVESDGCAYGYELRFEMTPGCTLFVALWVTTTMKMLRNSLRYFLNYSRLCVRSLHDAVCNTVISLYVTCVY